MLLLLLLLRQCDIQDADKLNANNSRMRELGWMQ